ncbi:uncharacterized protein A4U43_C04F34170 [Asparagus officinalis]|uniref:HIT-type domain-containing protein n=1 Tax=Asparagus officinalis TaxID=4686 RepID=A0A5P1FAL5_ASPOF|nr:zinc finger HIT domain-containing protein 2 [Asparagus officinalis]ONK73681.1 uncharacterized protein A4U43_C04F34170 [Asparagus officinalis]
MEKEVILSESSPSTSFSSEPRLICRVCQRQFSQYTCPRCNTRYCSLECYKRHSLRCTESFMKENVMGELRQIQPEDEDKRKMLEILKRFHSEEEDDGGGDGDEMNVDDEEDSKLSEELIQKVLSGDEIKLEDLSPEEVKQFHRAVASGELSKMIQPWTPWWKQPSAKTISLSPHGTQLINPLQEEEQDSNFDKIPSGPETPIPPLTQLSSTNPSPLLTVHLVDILYSYCFTLRLYNGDWRSDPLAAAMEILNISSVLGDDARPETVSEALSSCLEKTCSPAYKNTGGFRFGVGLIDDIICILSLGRNALVCSLCDLQRLVRDGEEAMKGERARKGKSSRKLKGVERKVYFLMCWVFEQQEEVWASLASILEVEKASVLAVAEGSKKPVKEGENRNKVLIQEV